VAARTAAAKKMANTTRRLVTAGIITQSSARHYQPPVRCICLTYTERCGRARPLASCIGFDWDDGNIQKNWERRRVTPEEAEDLFFNEPLVVGYYALGRTSSGRRLFAAFTVRRKLIRVISVRDMNIREQEAYKRHEEAHA
jgi:hypothetical protein